MSAGNRTCGSCGSHGWPQMSLNAAGKMKPACQNCGQEFQDADVTDFQVGKPVDAGNKALPDVAIAPVVPRPTATLGYAPPGPSAAVAPVAMPVPPVQRFDVIGSIRERAAYLEAEDARLEGVIADARARLAGIRVETKKLRKMLSAADRVSAITLSTYSPTGEPVHQ